jgi:hypothetical protein
MITKSESDALQYKYTHTGLLQNMTIQFVEINDLFTSSLMMLKAMLDSAQDRCVIPVVAVTKKDDIYRHSSTRFSFQRNFYEKQRSLYYPFNNQGAWPCVWMKHKILSHTCTCGVPAAWYWAALAGGPDVVAQLLRKGPLLLLHNPRRLDPNPSLYLALSPRMTLRYASAVLRSPASLSCFLQFSTRPNRCFFPAQARILPRANALAEQHRM